MLTTAIRSFAPVVLGCLLIGCAASTTTSIRSLQPLPPAANDDAARSSGPDGEHRIALVIGNGAYNPTIGVLKNPTRDAEDMAKALKDLGFEVALLRDASQAQIDEAMRNFGATLQKRGGVGLFYFAGHGIQLEGSNYLIPVDTSLVKETDVKYKGVNLEQILEEMDAAGNRLNIAILDACRNNPLKRRFRSVSLGLAEVPAPMGTLIFYATAPGSVAIDSEEGHNGVFTKHLLNAITTPGLTLSEIIQKVTNGVGEETQFKQTPWISGFLVGGDFYLSPPTPEQKPIAMPARLEGPLDASAPGATPGPPAVAPAVPQAAREISGEPQPNPPPSPKPLENPGSADQLAILVLFEEHNLLNPLQGIAVDLNATETALMAALRTYHRNLIFIDRTQQHINLERGQAQAAIEGDAKSAKAIGLLFDADYIITGKSWANTRSLKPYGEDFDSAQATVTARLVRVATGEIMATESASGRFAPVLDPTADNSKALARAANELAERLARSIPASTGLIIVTLTEAEHADSQAFRRLLAQVTGIDHVQPTQFQKPVARYRVTGGVSAAALAGELTGKRINGRTLSISSVDNGSLMLRLR